MNNQDKLAYISKVKKDSRNLINKMTAHRNVLKAEIENGDLSLRQEYTDVCTDILQSESDLLKLTLGPS